MKRAAIAEVDDIGALPPGVEACRDERCSVLGVHAAHQVVGRRGRTSSTCPACFKPIVKIDKVFSCTACSWSRKARR